MIGTGDPPPGGRSRSGNKNAPPCGRKSAFFAFSAHAKPRPSIWKKAPLTGPIQPKRRTQLFLLSDPPHPWIYFDYDPGPLFCVHLQVSMFFFIIAPQKIGVNPKPWIYRNFYNAIHKQNTPPGVAAHRKGCFVWILPWCEEESCYLGSGCGPASHGKSITAFTIQFVKKL